MTLEELKSQNNGSAMPTYARFELGLEHGKGAVAYDVDGRSYIDFGSGIGVNSLGYCDDGWVDAICGQAKKLQHTSNLYYNTATAQLTEKLVEKCGMDKVFMANSGAEANECAIKIARKYSFDKYGEGRSTVITLNNSFHGRTMASLTATGQEVMHPDCFAPFIGGFKYADANIDSVKAAVDDTVCAVMMEMIQGEGGVMPLDKQFVSDVCALAAEHDILIIVDEVQAGMARTGKLLAYQHYGISPDVVTLAKGLGGGLPIGACMCGKKLAEVMSGGSHGSTFGGNPVACAGASYVLDVISEPKFLNEVAEKGEYIRKKVSTFKNVKSIRGLGMMIGIEVDGKVGVDVVKSCIEKGLIVLNAKTIVRLLPPLNITYDELDKGLEILKTVIEE